MGKIPKTVTLRSVGNRNKGNDISQEPEMEQLKELYRDMDEPQKDRTIKHLEDATNQQGGYYE